MKSTAFLATVLTLIIGSAFAAFPVSVTLHCNFELCTARGAQTACRTPDTKRATTCGGWAARTDGGVRPVCGRICLADCKLGMPDAPADNNGKRFCNECVLRVASCNSGFAFFGPVKHPTPTTVSRVASASCSVDLCTARGALTPCMTPDKNSVSTCGGWATRKDGGVKPDCDFGCLANCPGGFKDNIGRDYCNECNIRLESCRANFAFFGPIVTTTSVPVPPVVTTPCSFFLCTARGAMTRCMAPGTKRSTTCGGWATRTDGGSKPVCNLPCQEPCPGGFKDNNGRDFCTKCLLRVDSCRANFAFFGPELEASEPACPLC